MDKDNGTDSNPFDENTPDISAPALEDTNLNPVEDDHSGRNFVWLLLGIAAMVCGLLFAAAFFFFQPDAKSMVGKYFPSPTATSTPTPTSTPTVTPTRTTTPTPTATLPPHVLITPSHGEIVFEETFDTNSQNWDGYYDGSTALVKDGKLIIRSDEKGYIGLAVCTSCLIFSDVFYFQADVTTLVKTTESYGLAFCSRGYGQEFYVFQINTEHETFDLYLSTSTGWEELLVNRPASVINSFPASNTLGIFFDRGDLMLYINNVLVQEYKGDNPLGCRRIGFMVDEGKIDMAADNVFVYNVQATATPIP